jgi:hypothetical protein
MNEVNLTTSGLENVFGIESGTTISKVQPQQTTEIMSTDDTDTFSLINEEDRAVSSQLSTIYGYAIDAFEQQTQMVQEVDPKFAARNAEVAAQYLTIALNSVNTRAKVRHEKLKLKVEGSGPSTVNNNLIVADRNEILKMLANQPTNIIESK